MRRKKKKLSIKRIILFILLMGALILSFVIIKNSGSSKDSIKKESKTNERENVSEISNKEKEEIDISKLKSKVLEYIASFNNNISVSYYNFNLEDGFSINGDIQYFPASTSKLYSVITLYDYAFQNKLDINSYISYTSKDYQEGTGILQNQDLSKAYSLLTLSDYAIKYSDNIAYKMISRTVGYSNIKSNYESIIGHQTSSGTYTMSSDDAMKLLKRVYYNTDDNKLYDHLIEIMKDTEFSDRIAKYLPKDIVAHKIGNYNEYVHDAAIIDDKDNPYILTVFTKGLNDAYETIANISKLIYEFE